MLSNIELCKKNLFMLNTYCVQGYVLATIMFRILTAIHNPDRNSHPRKK